MIWWLWIVLGMLLLGIELLAVDTAFYLVFLGFSSLFVGAVAWLTGLGPGLDWLLFGVVAGISLMSFRARVYARFLPADTSDDAARLIGAAGICREAIEPGAKGAVELRGTTWSGENAGATPLAVGQRCVVADVAGIVLRVRATGAPHAAVGSRSEPDPEPSRD